MFNASAETECIGFLLVPGFSMFSFSSLIEPLRTANYISDQKLYQWHIYSQDNQVVYASNGLPFMPSRLLTDTQDLDAAFIVAGLDIEQQDTAKAQKWIKKLFHANVTVGSTSTGTELLADAGLLNGVKCTIHWQNRETLLEKHPNLTVTSELYEMDKNIMTCSGGLAGLDMMLQLISKKHSLDLAKQVSENYVHANIRPSDNEQRMDLTQKFNTNHPRLLKALQLMKSHMEDILSCEDISDRVGLSSRQLERLFQHYLQITPTAYYMTLRLEKARYLLLQSSISILQISMACGFKSTSYFSKCYRKQYQHTPSMERKTQK